MYLDKQEQDDLNKNLQNPCQNPNCNGIYEKDCPYCNFCTECLEQEECGDGCVDCLEKEREVITPYSKKNKVLRHIIIKQEIKIKELEKQIKDND